jgi:alpha-tubulin suppressor-like RCC1 family protein
LGLGDTTTRRTPEVIPTLSNVIKIFAGGQELGISGAITKSGDLYLWGCNSHGQLGFGSDFSEIHTPKLSPMENIKTLAMGGNHMLFLTCMLKSTFLLILKDKGKVLGCGRGDNKQNGNKKAQALSTPQPVHGIEDIAFTDIRASGYHSAALSRIFHIII